MGKEVAVEQLCKETEEGKGSGKRMYDAEQVILKQVDHEDIDFLSLCKELDLFLDQAIGGADKREKYKGFNQTDSMDYVVVAYVDHKPVGCGALRQYSEEEIEVKRVFVQEAFRGAHIGALILEDLVSCAKQMAYKRMILETGAFLSLSVRLYERYGFERIENYGAYKDMPESLCMGRGIGEDAVYYCTGRWIAADDLRELFASVGWLSAQYADRLVKAVQKAGTVISAWQDQKLIGLIEVLDDGELTAYIHYLLVHPQYQHRGIAGHMLDAVKLIYQDYLYLILLSEKQSTIPFYEKYDFALIEGSTPMQIRHL